MRPLPRPHEHPATGDATPRIGRRHLLRLIGAGLLTGALAGCGAAPPWHETDVTGAAPALHFTMQRASDGKEVTEADYRGKIVLVYFGYTYCPDVCPTTLANLAQIVGGLGDKADAVRVLFVTVDPKRDTLPVLKEYVANFGPQVVGLRGTQDQIAAFARSHRILYSVNRKANGDYEVTHTPAVYVFDRDGRARLLIGSLAGGNPDIAGITADLERLIAEPA